jgi:hypothetical protein
MADHNPQHGRRPHFHRGRRGPDRRGGERRSPQAHASEPGARESAREPGGVDVEQVMREIRSRIAQRHGIELTTPQIQELAARRLEAILEPRNVKPQLLEQLRKSAGAGPDIPEPAAIDTYAFEDTTLYETHRGLLRFFRRLLHPILKLLFNPTPLIDALNKQARINTELIKREAERERRQAEWNALHYELVQRIVAETARLSIEMQSLTATIESLGAKVDFNERRVRSVETVPPASQPRPRPHEPRQHESRPEGLAGSEAERRPRQQEPRPLEPTFAAAPPNAEAAPAASTAANAEAAGEGTRRRRRRRRGRRSGSGVNESPGAADGAATVDAEDVDGGDGNDVDDDESTAQQVGTGEPAGMPHKETTAAPDDVATADAAPARQPAAPEESTTPSRTWTQVHSASERVEPTVPIEPALPGATAEPTPELPAHVVPSPPHDEPAPARPVDHAEPGPEDR